MGHKDFGVRVEIPNEPETAAIEHDQWGRVEGAKAGFFGHSPGIKGWEKDGAIRLSCDGWREVKPKRWATYARQELKDNEVWRFLSVWFEGEMDTRRFDLPDGYRWKKVEIEREVEG